MDMKTEDVLMRLTGVIHHIQMDLDDGCTNPQFWLGIQNHYQMAVDEITRLSKLSQLAAND